MVELHFMLRISFCRKSFNLSVFHFAQNSCGNMFYLFIFFFFGVSDKNCDNCRGVCMVPFLSLYFVHIYVQCTTFISLQYFLKNHIFNFFYYFLWTHPSFVRFATFSVLFIRKWKKKRKKTETQNENRKKCHLLCFLFLFSPSSLSKFETIFYKLSDFIVLNMYWINSFLIGRHLFIFVSFRWHNVFAREKRAF